MTNELKPCPFCGSEAKLFTARGKCNQIVRCVACNVSPGYRQTKKEAIEAWNTRAERTCSIEWREYDGAYFCTACKADLPYPLQECWDDYQAGNGEKPLDCCPSCGAKVVEE